MAVWWFNPGNNEVKKVSVKDKVPVISFTPLAFGVENDWVLVPDDPRYNYGAPGMRKRRG